MLLILAETPGKVVRHEVILDKVWPDVKVAPNALQRCIAQLRKAFQDNAKKQHTIVTQPKVGYALIADVKQHSEPTTTEQRDSEIKIRLFSNLPAIATFTTALVLLALIYFSQ